MERTEEKLTYKRAQSNADIFRYLKAIALPVFNFLLAMFTIDHFNLFGYDLIAPLTGVMWGCGALVAFFQPSHRRSVLKETHVTTAVYLISLIVIKELISTISGVSAEMLMATYNQVLPVTSGAAFSGYMQSLLWITTIMTPVGFIFMQVKKLFTMHRNQEAKKFHDKLLGTRRNGKHFD